MRQGGTTIWTGPGNGNSAAGFRGPATACHRQIDLIAPMPYGARQAQGGFDAIGHWTEGSESAAHIAWEREIWGRLEPHLLGRAFINHIAADDQPEKIRASFGGNFRRLRETKAVYGKANLFRVNSNIPPA